MFISKGNLAMEDKTKLKISLVFLLGAFLLFLSSHSKADDLLAQSDTTSTEQPEDSTNDSDTNEVVEEDIEEYSPESDEE